MTAGSRLSAGNPTPDGGELTLFNPFGANWDCLLLDQGTEDSLSTFYDSSDTLLFKNSPTLLIHSCDMVLDYDEDGLLISLKKPQYELDCKRFRHGLA